MQKIIKPLYFVGIVLVFLTTAMVFVWYATGISYGAQTIDRQCPSENHYKDFSFFSATTTNATSTADGSIGMDIKCAEKVTLHLTHGGVATTSTGTNVFNVQVSPDEGTTWYDFNKLVQNLSTSTVETTLARITVGASTSTVLVTMDLQDFTFSRVRVISVETGTEGQQGESTATGIVEF